MAALAVVGVLSLYVLWEVVWTVFFALTFVYVLHPTRRRLVRGGMAPRLAAGLLTAFAFTGVLALFAPVLLVLYQRRTSIVAFLRTFPVSIDLSFGGFSYTIDVQALVPVVRETLSGWAVSMASAAPVIGMKVFLFVFLVYALLYQPGGVRRLLFRTVGDNVQAEMTAYHERIRETLYGLYVVQAATGALTFVLALPVFAVLGYSAFFSLSVVAGILQFVPVIGPSAVVLAIAGAEFAAGDVPQAILVTVLGLALIGFLPDALIRPRLAEHTAGISPSLYFVGFVGGVFTLGPIGIIAGPLLLALLVETLELIAEEADETTASPFETHSRVDGERSSLDREDHPQGGALDGGSNDDVDSTDAAAGGNGTAGETNATAAQTDRDDRSDGTDQPDRDDRSDGTDQPDRDDRSDGTEQSDREHHSDAEESSGEE